MGSNSLTFYIQSCLSLIAYYILNRCDKVRLQCFLLCSAGLVDSCKITQLLDGTLEWSDIFVVEKTWCWYVCVCTFTWI